MTLADLTPGETAKLDEIDTKDPWRYPPDDTGYG